jgi:hypothetical protein
MFTTQYTCAELNDIYHMMRFLLYMAGDPLELFSPVLCLPSHCLRSRSYAANLNAVVALTSGQFIPLSAAPVFPRPAQLYNPTGLFCVARRYWRSTHCSAFASAPRFSTPNIRDVACFHLRVPGDASSAIRPSAIATHFCATSVSLHSLR